MRCDGMKLASWIVIIVSILAVAWLSISIDSWAGEWKSLFFYLDDWKMWVIVIVIVWLIKSLAEWFLKMEVRVLK